jgi:glycine cleavage system P protein (glycine dehydrogenase) subunit 2
LARRYRQARWDEPLLSELSRKGRTGFVPPRDPKIEVWRRSKELLPAGVRTNDVKLPEIAELQLLRHFNRLSQMNFSVESGTYPLGSCTMKYNPKVSEYIASSPGMREAHPFQPEGTIQGLLGIFYDLSAMLCEITGMKAFSLTPAAGAQGEFAGVLMMRKYLHERGHPEKDEILVPDSAHGTNPASAAMGAFKVIKVPSDERGLVNLEQVEKLVSARTAGMMLTVPNTLGLFESDVGTISRMIHDAGGLMYYDGANMNALLGKARPGDMGFDIVHLNLHKTFATPHGGGGPGAGPVGVTERLQDYLPVPVVTKVDEGYHLNYDVPHTIGRMKGSYANSAILLRAYCYIRLLGANGLDNVSSLSVLAANYLLSRLNPEAYALLQGKGLRRKHEAIVSVQGMMSGGAMKVAKGLLDYGVHSPTVYFPLTVEEALMIEPTESETLEALDEYAELLNGLHEKLQRGELEDEPKNTSVGKIDEVKASHPLSLRVKW